MRVPVAAVACYLLSLIASIGAQELDPIKKMCIRFDHQSVLKNGTLYIDGGRETFINVNGTGDQVGNVTEGYNDHLIAIDMNKSWDWKTNISETALNKTANPQTGTRLPVLSRGALYHGANKDDNIYLWGGTTSYYNTSSPGFQSPTTKQYSLWSYNIATKAWDQYDVTSGSPNRPSSGSYTDATDQGLSFFFNGMLDSGSEIQTQKFGNGMKQYLEGMIVIDTNYQTARNLSTKTVVGDMPRARGRMQYVSGIGDNGILVQIGGYQQSITNTTDSCNNGDPVPMNEIDVFDVSSYYNASTPDGTWYKQITSGATPDPRVDFCIILACATDGTSHNIYMYGGRGNEYLFYDDIWVLSLPSFTWTKIYQGTSPRYGHTCHRVGNRTMITVGGAANSNYDSTPCDWETKGVGVLDMSDLTWGSVFSATDGDYGVPFHVAAVIGGGPSGGATMNQPAGGFNQSGLSALFRVPYDSGPVNSTTPCPKSSNTATPPSGSRPNPCTVPIITGLVGGIAFITLTASLGFLYRKRIRHFITGGEWPFQEMDGDQKVQHEIMTRDICWELPVEEKPVELWSPDERDIKPPIFSPGDQGPAQRTLSPVFFRDFKPPILSPIVRDTKPVSLSPIELDARPPSFKSTITINVTKPLSFKSSERDTKTRFPSPANPDTKAPSLIPTSKYTQPPPSLSPSKGDAKTLQRSPTIRRPKPLELNSTDKPLPKLP